MKNWVLVNKGLLPSRCTCALQVMRGCVSGVLLVALCDVSGLQFYLCLKIFKILSSGCKIFLCFWTLKKTKLDHPQVDHSNLFCFQIAEKCWQSWSKKEGKLGTFLFGDLLVGEGKRGFWLHPSHWACLMPTTSGLLNVPILLPEHGQFL